MSFFIARHRGRNGDAADPAESTMIGGLADAIRVVAKHYVQALAEVVKKLSGIAARLRKRRMGMSEKNRRRLAQLDAPGVEQRMVSHALIEMDKLARKKTPPRLDAVRYAKLLGIEMPTPGADEKRQPRPLGPRPALHLAAPPSR